MQSINVFPKEDINYQLQLILDSPAFRSSPTLAKFLTFIISETLLERGHYIKEYNIAISVLNRSRDFNPQDDAVVRIHAGRLRRALNEYYLIQGMNDPIVISIPKGGYIPQVEIGTPGKSTGLIAPAFSKPVVNPIIAVFPFHTIPQKPTVKTFSLILSEQISAELSRVQDFTVIGYYSAEMLEKIEQNIIEAGKSLHADYVITGNVQYYDQVLRIGVNLLLVESGEVRLIKFLEKKGMFSGIFEMQDEVIQSVIRAVGVYHGIVSQESVP